MTNNTIDQRIDALRRRQSVSTRQYAIAKERQQSWYSLLKGIALVEKSYSESDKLPADLVNTFFEVSKYANEQYGKLGEYLSEKNIELEDINAKIRVSAE
jgi:hypothetical protein